VVLADSSGYVTCFFEKIGHRIFIRILTTPIAIGPRTAGVSPCPDGVTGWDTLSGLTEGILKPDSLFGKSVKVGRTDFRIAVTSQSMGIVLIGHDKQHIGLFSLWRIDGITLAGYQGTKCDEQGRILSHWSNLNLIVTVTKGLFFFIHNSLCHPGGIVGVYSVKIGNIFLKDMDAKAGFPRSGNLNALIQKIPVDAKPNKITIRIFTSFPGY
jgi:hypothetical protein